MDDKETKQQENEYLNDNVDPYGHITEEEEDNDGHGKEDEHSKGNSTFYAASLHIINSIMGAGILSLPVVFRYLGIILGVLFIGSIAAANVFSVALLLRCQDMTKKNGYAMFSKITFGAAGSLLVKIIIIINNFGMCCAYFRIFGETAHNLASVFADADSFWVTNYHNYFYVVIIFVVMGFLVFKENLNSLKHASFLGVVGITIFIISLIIIFFYKVAQGLTPEFDSSILWPQGTAYDFIDSLPTVFLAYTFQFNVFPIYFTLKNRTKQEMKRSVNLAITACFLIYSMTGILGYYMYRDSLKDTILSALTVDVTTYKGNDNFLIVILVIINIAFLISSTMSIPLMFFSLKQNFLNSIIFCRKKFGRRSQVDVEQREQFLDSVERPTCVVSQQPDTVVNNAPMSQVTKYSTIILLYIVIAVITILVPGLKIIFNLVGSTAANSISFILPSLFFIKLSSMGSHSVNKVLPWIFLVAGSVMLVVCLAGEILKLIAD